MYILNFKKSDENKSRHIIKGLINSPITITRLTTMFIYLAPHESEMSGRASVMGNGGSLILYK